jgi:hypothetical protein
VLPWRNAFAAEEENRRNSTQGILGDNPSGKMYNRKSLFRSLLLKDSTL